MSGYEYSTKSSQACSETLACIAVIPAGKTNLKFGNVDCDLANTADKKVVFKDFFYGYNYIRKNKNML